MDYTERMVRDRLDGKINRVPNGFWNYNTLSMAVKIIIEEKLGIIPKDIPAENMKNPIPVRFAEEQVSIASIIHYKYRITLKDMIMKTYGITSDDWYLFNDIKKLYELKVQGYKFSRNISSYGNVFKLYCKLYLYGLTREDKILTRNNIIEVSKDVFRKLGWFYIEENTDKDVYGILGYKCNTIRMSEFLCKCFPHSFQAHDFRSPIIDIKYAINYEIHVREELSHNEFTDITGIWNWAINNNKNTIRKLIARYYSNNQTKNMDDFKNLIEWEGPLYDKLMQELEYVKTHKIPFGYKDGDTSEFKINL